METRILFRLNAGKKYGLGHFSRSHALASLFLKEANVLFFLNIESKEIIDHRIDKYIQTIYITNEDDFFNNIEHNDIVILDGYEFGEIFRNNVKAKCKRLICIEDLPNGHYTCNAIINSANEAKNQYYSKENYTQLFFGYEYALLNKVFFGPISNNNRNGILISMGSIDPFNVTTDIINALLSIKYTLQIHVIYTDNFTYVQQEFIERLASENKIIAYKNLTSLEVKNLMDKTQFGIFPTSNVLLEALKRKVICAFGYFIENQVLNYRSFVSLNVGLPLDNLKKVEWIKVLKKFLIVKTTYNESFSSVIGSKINNLKSFILYGN